MLWLIAWLIPVFFSVSLVKIKPDSSEYFVCGRKAGTGTVAFSIVASCVGGSATISMAGLAWHAGVPAFWLLGAGCIGLVILYFFLADKIRTAGVLTMPEIVGIYLGNNCRYVASCVISIAWMAILAAQYSAAGVIISALTGMDAITSLLAGAAIILAYTALGGQNSVMKSDIWQFFILFITIALALLFLCQHTPAKEALITAKLELTNDKFSSIRLCYLLFVIGGSYVVCPMLFGRLLSAKNPASAKKGTLLAIFGLCLAAILIVAFGLAARGIIPPGCDPEKVLDNVIRHALPEWLANAVLIGILSAVVSSADSCLITAASIAANDILRKKEPLICRIAMLVFTAGAIFLSVKGGSILSLLLMANNIYVCGIVWPVFFGILAKSNVLKNSPIPMAAMTGGGMLGITGSLFEKDIIVIAGCLFSFGICFIFLAYHKISQILLNAEVK